jgi:hypothetical protein
MPAGNGIVVVLHNHGALKGLGKHDGDGEWQNPYMSRLMLGDRVHPCGGVVQVCIGAQLVVQHQSLPWVRWAGWAKAITAHRLGNVQAEDLHCFSALGNLSATSHEIF